MRLQFKTRVSVKAGVPEAAGTIYDIPEELAEKYIGRGLAMRVEASEIDDDTGDDDTGDDNSGDDNSGDDDKNKANELPTPGDPVTPQKRGSTKAGG